MRSNSEIIIENYRDYDLLYEYAQRFIANPYLELLVDKFRHPLADIFFEGCAETIRKELNVKSYKIY